MTSANAPDPIVALSATLRRSGLDLDAENLADLFWLWAHIDQVRSIPPLEEAAAEPIAIDSDPKSTSLPPSSEPISSSRQEDTSRPAPAPAASLRPIDAPQPNRQRLGSKQTPVDLPTAPALRQPLALGRALRPLMRKVPSRREQLLDEEATANLMAERRICIPVMRPAPERWLSLTLLIESTDSTQIWQAPIRDFQRLLERQGAFRSVRTWQLYTGQAEPQLLAKPHTPERQQRSCSPKELIDPSGRNLVLLISDCTSAAWRRGQLQGWLTQWAREQPVAILQLLPERLWERSALGLGFPAQLSALRPGLPNTHLSLQSYTSWSQLEAATALKLPVITLQPESILQWARVLAGAGNAQTAGVVFEANWSTAATELLPAAALPPAEPAALVKRFQTTASPTARKLASLMAAVPVRMPIIHLLQETLVPESNQVHVAEVFMSGLLEPTLTAEASSQYDFRPGVRNHLLASAAIPEVDTVLSIVSQYIARRANLPHIKGFTALLTLPPKTDGDSLELEEFARLTRDVLRRLGGEYAAFAHALDQAEDDETAAVSVLVFPPLQTLTFETAQLIEAEAEIPSVEIAPFTFEVATLERERQLQRWRIRRQRRQAQRYIERLGDGISTAMVAIPGGSFVMGSPEDEPGRYSNESPQHNVSVEPFFMGRYPITQAQWRVVADLPEVNQALEPDPARFKGDNHPVERVSWSDAIEFCARLSVYTQRRYRLPTEAEWEYACRAGTTTPFHFGKMITTEVANYNGSAYGNGPQGESREATTLVDHFGIANAFGLSDMHGNVWEWCQDHWHNNYEGAPTNGSAWLSKAEDEKEDEDIKRVIRGGSWYGLPWFCRSAIRYNSNPRDTLYSIGVRIVCSAP